MPLTRFPVTCNSNKFIFKLCVLYKTGVDITANQEEETDNETFQAEYIKQHNKWAFKTIHNKYWTFDQVTSGVQDKSSEM